ncbi:hypothetical protein KH5_13940 [Urechidicola sp. KH5]
MDIKEIYQEIFKSYGHIDLSSRIQKIIDLDRFLPYSSTFFSVTNTRDLSFHYISKNVFSILGYTQQEIVDGGMRFFWSKIHPEDIDIWLKTLADLMQFTMNEIAVEDRRNMTYVWNYRMINSNGAYVNIVQNTTPLEFDEHDKPIIGLAHYTVLHGEVPMPITASAKLMNEQNEYETVYFNNFSQRLLTDGLSNRERDVIRLLALDYTSKEISSKLNISSNTVDTHRRNILKKLKVSSTGELVGLIKSYQLIL